MEMVVDGRKERKERRLEWYLDREQQRKRGWETRVALHNRPRQLTKHLLSDESLVPPYIRTLSLTNLGRCTATSTT